MQGSHILAASDTNYLDDDHCICSLRFKLLPFAEGICEFKELKKRFNFTSAELTPELDPSKTDVK
jgi:hypothetical protein